MSYHLICKYWVLDTDEETEVRLSRYQPLYIDAIKGDWESASKFIEQEPDAVRVKITASSETALHVAFSSGRRNHFVKKLVEKMAPEDLAVAEDLSGMTALHIAAAPGNFEAAKLLADKNPNLPNASDSHGEIPHHYTARRGNSEMFLYLLDDGELKSIGDSSSGAQLLCNLASSGLYEVPMKLENITDHHSGGDIENPVDCFISGSAFVKQILNAIFWEVAGKIGTD